MKRHLATIVGTLLAVAALAFCVEALRDEWARVEAALEQAEWAWLALGLVLAAVGMTVIAVRWRACMRTVGAEPPETGRVVRWYYAGELGKYLPGGVWPVVGRGELARRDGVPRGHAYVSVGLSLATLYLAAAFVALLVLPFSLAGGGELGPEMLLLFLLPLGLLALHPRVVEPVLGFLRRVTHRELAVPVPPWRDTVLAVARYMPARVVVAAATWLVARSIDPDAPIARVAFAAVLSWIAGFAAVPVPAGAGVREAVFIAASGLDSGLGATVAVATRVLFILADAGGAAVSAPFLRRRRERAATPR